MNLEIRTKFIARLRGLNGAQSGAALTEFAITLPIFVLLLTALMQLGNMGHATVKVKTAAYGEMWEKSYEMTNYTIDENQAVYTPRAELFDAVPDGFSANEILDSVDSIATGAGGHWGESMLKANLAPLLSGGQISHHSGETSAAERLSELGISSAPHTVMTEIIGESRGTRTSFAVNDNLADDSIMNHTEDMQGGSGIASSIVGGLTTGLGVIPSLFAGVRHGEAQGTATADVEYTNRFLPHSTTFSAGYTTGLSPHAGDESSIPGMEGQFAGIGREETQYLFYYLTGQTVDNKRVALNILDPEWDESQNFDNPTRY